MFIVLAVAIDAHGSALLYFETLHSTPVLVHCLTAKYAAVFTAPRMMLPGNQRTITMFSMRSM